MKLGRKGLSSLKDVTLLGRLKLPKADSETYGTVKLITQSGTTLGGLTISSAGALGVNHATNTALGVVRAETGNKKNVDIDPTNGRLMVLQMDAITDATDETVLTTLNTLLSELRTTNLLKER